MLILAVDTSGRKGSIALCRDDFGAFEVLQFTSLEGGTYSAQLVPRIAEALLQNHRRKTELDGLVVVSGPGSFTGLRVGLATVKGLCEVLRKPLAAFSMLEALALTHGSAGETITAVLDAGRGEVYVGQYHISGERADVLQEYIAKLDAFAAASSALEGHLLTPDDKIAQALHGRVKTVAPIQADEIGRIGVRKLRAGDTADPATIDVNYIRSSDAEIFSAPKH
jgi:tRNA threonylcarbamoyladenosine biosynthesis protein TsaB